MKLHRKAIRRQTKLNNKGMSLVEVIVAITILSIVIVPVLQSLTTAMAYNYKARTRQKLTLVGESIMETFKGYSIAEIKDMFNGTSYVDADSNPTQGPVSGVTGGEYKLLSYDGTTGKYTFTITGFTEGNSTYDAEIILSPVVSQGIYEASNVQTLNNAVFIANSNWDSNTINDIFSNVYSSGDDPLYKKMYNALIAQAASTEDEDHQITGYRIDGTEYGADGITEDALNSLAVKDYLTIQDRTLTITVTKDGTVYKANAKLEYHYSIENFPFTVIETAKIQPGVIYDTDTLTTEREDSVSCKSDDGGYWSYEVSVSGSEITGPEFYNSASPIDRLYIYYYPLYTAADNIKIEYSGDTALDCYVLKQRPSEININIVKLNNYETSYIPTISASNLSTFALNLYHNMNENLSGDTTSGGGLNSTGFTKVGKLSDGLNQKTEKLSYDISLVITDNTTSNKICELNSSVLEKISTGTK